MQFEKEYPFILNANHIAEILGCSKRIAYDVMEYNDFPLIRVGRHKKVQRDAFLRWIENHEKKDEKEVM